MNGRMQTKGLVFTGIIALHLILPITPMSYAASSADSPDVMTQKLKSSKPNQEAGEKSSNNVPIQGNDSKKDQDELAGPLRDFHRNINRLFDQTFRDFGFSAFDMGRPFFQTSGGIFRPMTDLAANDKEYTITVEVPGAKKDDIKIEVANNVMTISGEKKQEKEEKQQDFYRQERYYGSFQRVLPLPQDADQDHIKADFNQGVLTVTMPRKDMPKPTVKEIEIQSN